MAAGGVAALSACLDRESEVPAGDPDRRPGRQHAWNGFLERDSHGNPQLPEHHVFLSLAYEGDDRDGDRAVVQEALTDLERAYEASNDGLLFTVGYSPAYFERFDDPIEADLPPPGPVHGGEHVATDDADAFLHLASDHASAVMAARQALFGEGEANGTDVTGLEGVFAVERRRTGFVGPGLPAANDANLLGLPEGAVDDAAPTFTNFRSGFRGSQATEDRVTLREGRFAGGTTQHVELFRLQLGEWFEHSADGRVARLFAPDLGADDVGERGERLTDDTPVEAADGEALREVAEEHGVVGHVQKLARFREDGRPPILRRDVDSADNGEAGMVFVSLQRGFAEFRTLRLAMEGRDLAAETPVGERRDNGILQYVRNRRRGNFLVPPRRLRALP